jgi:hypothetical protein
MITISRNARSPSTGIDDQLPPELVITIDRNTHPDAEPGIHPCHQLLPALEIWYTLGLAFEALSLLYAFTRTAR